MSWKDYLINKTRARAFLGAGLVLVLYYPWMDAPFNSMALVAAGLNLVIAAIVWLRIGLANGNLLKDR